MKFEVEGMSCGHCAETVAAAVKAVEPAAEVQIDLEQGQVIVKGSDRRDAVAAAIEEAGYGVKASV